MHGFEERQHAGPGHTHAAQATILLTRMRTGDRDAVGEFIATYGSRIRRRVRGQLGPAMRSVFDSQEILSTVARRLDEIVSSRRLRAEEENQLWSLVFRIATNAVLDKAKVFRRLRRAEGSDRAFAHELLARLEDADRTIAFGGEMQLEGLLHAVPDPIDRQILEMWLRDVTHAGIGRALDMPPGTVRRRWMGIKARLGPRLEQGLRHGQTRE